MSTLSKAKKKSVKAAQRYEQNPPRCSSCLHYSASQNSSPPTLVMGQVMQPALKYLPPHCKLGGFACSPHAICDEWEHKATGERLMESK